MFKYSFVKKNIPIELRRIVLTFFGFGAEKSILSALTNYACKHRNKLLENLTLHFVFKKNWLHCYANETLTIDKYTHLFWKIILDDAYYSDDEF
jgi:hypothetical protein